MEKEVCFISLEGIGDELVRLILMLKRILRRCLKSRKAVGASDHGVVCIRMTDTGRSYQWNS